MHYLKIAGGYLFLFIAEQLALTELLRIMDGRQKAEIEAKY